MAAPLVFDRALARRRLERAHREGFIDFLVARAAEDLADRLAAVKRTFDLALDLGTPTDAAVAALAASGQAGRIIRAAPTIAALGGGRGDTLVADEEALPFAEGRFDLAVSLLALQGVNDLPGALVQIRRGLKADGLFLAALFGGSTLTELRQILAEAESEIEGGVSPRVAPFIDIRDMGALLQRAGFALPVTDIDTVKVRYEHPIGLMRDLRAMGLTNSLVERRRKPLKRETLAHAVALYYERYAEDDGRVPATFDILWVSGWVPHESQQKPLQPGSAKMRLADALNTKEIKTGDRG
ncbi:methyltransferase domain-containing protein [Chelatococcus asaccharovorans]|uniref:Methyltransferase family protein n=1 Tax=Chelatococcus asaccharovorans TaxID=28210 RepID=A0A2V3UHS2_9HYPH|nr:methyltransferase domain-containing protein [Chelatococcus asaccharovorans]MBS7706432.1 methyltransferase domain-containing protein [Chelatococcus asaccharovorans]PXW64925.1 methyltransferase family protein [Chelatococcus asaccharovorans]